MDANLDTIYDNSQPSIGLNWEFPGINKISYVDASQYLPDGFLYWMLLGVVAKNSTFLKWLALYYDFQFSRNTYILHE